MSVFTMFMLSVAAVVSNNDTLTGRVLDENGVPISGAVVDIYTANRASVRRLPALRVTVTAPSRQRPTPRDDFPSANSTRDS